MEESSVPERINAMRVVHNPCCLVQQAVRAIAKCFGFQESGNQSNPEAKSNYSPQEDEQRNQTSPANQTPVVEKRIIVPRRVPPPPLSRGGGGQIN